MPWTFIGGIVALLIIWGFLAPNSPPGKFLWTGLAVFGLAGDNFKAKNALANKRAALRRAGGELIGGVDNAADYEALIAKRTREKGKKMDEADELEDQIEQLESEGVADTDPRLVSLATNLMSVQERINVIDADLARLGATSKNVKSMLKANKENIVRQQIKTDEQEVDLKLSEVEERLARQNSKFSATGEHDTLEQIDQQVDDQIVKNRSRANAVQEILGDPVEDGGIKERISNRKASEFLANRRAAKNGTSGTSE